jgi:cullin-4
MYFSTESRCKIEVEGVSAQEFLSHSKERGDEEEGRARDVMLHGTVSLVKDASIRALFEGKLEWMAKEGASRTQFSWFIFEVMSF